MLVTFGGWPPLNIFFPISNNRFNIILHVCCSTSLEYFLFNNQSLIDTFPEYCSLFGFVWFHHLDFIMFFVQMDFIMDFVQTLGSSRNRWLLITGCTRTNLLVSKHIYTEYLCNHNFHFFKKICKSFCYIYRFFFPPLQYYGLYCAGSSYKIPNKSISIPLPNVENSSGVNA